MNPGSSLAAREWTLAALAGLALVIFMSWPLAAELAHQMPGKWIGDPYITAWQIAWEGHSLLSAPTEIFDVSIFWPLDEGLQFIDALHGYAPFGMIGEGIEAAVIRHNLIFIGAYTLCFVGVYALGRELGLDPFGAAIAGIAFAYSPWRLEHVGQIHIVSAGAIPLSLCFLLRGSRQRRIGLIATGWGLATWQITIGFNLGVPWFYLLCLLGLITVLLWWRRGRPSFDRRVVAAHALGFTLLCGVLILQALPYLEVATRYPLASHAPKELLLYSPPPRAFLAASSHSLLWASATESVRDSLPWAGEQVLFPGLAGVILAIAGLRTRIFQTQVRYILGGLIPLVAVLALGMNGPAPNLIYGSLFRWLPGWNAMRTPGRLLMWATLCIALLAGAGAMATLRRVARWRPQTPVVATASATLLAAAVLLDGAGWMNLGPVRYPPADLHRATAPQLHLPMGEIPDRTYMLWSIDGWPDMVNGLGAFTPIRFKHLARNIYDFPSTASVARLRALGVETVVLHHDLAPFTPWQDTASLRAPDTVEVERYPKMTLYRL